MQRHTDELLAFKQSPLAYLTAGLAVLTAALLQLLDVVASILQDGWVAPIHFPLFVLTTSILINGLNAVFRGHDCPT